MDGERPAPGFEPSGRTNLKRDRPEGVKRRSGGVERHAGHWLFAAGFDSPRPTKKKTRKCL